MDAVDLLREARASGLSISADGDQLVVTGPKSAAEIVRKLAENKSAVLAALRGSNHLSALSAVGGTHRNTEELGGCADADKLVEPPRACRTCGGCIGWQAHGRIACWSCEPPPAEAEKLVLSDTDAGPAWRRYDDERPVKVQQIDGPSPWDEAIPWEATTPSCPKCKSAEGWTDALDGWHCWKCCPPHRTEKVLNDRERILQGAWRRLGRRHGR